MSWQRRKLVRSRSSKPPRWFGERTASALVRLQVEQLEPRSLPSATSGLGLETEPNDTLDHAQDLGTLTPLGQARILGTTGGTDVDWFRVSLSEPTRLTLSGLGEGSLATVLSLYQPAPDTVLDPENAPGYRLLAQNDGRDGDAYLERLLPAGSYFVAVSGSGNRFFHPFLADSGLPGQAGAYQLVLTTGAAVAEADAGPVVLATNPRPGDILDRAPQVLRVQLSEGLDPGTLRPNQTVQLVYSATGRFEADEVRAVPLAWYHFDATAAELQLAPAATLKPGHYRLLLAGDQSQAQRVLTDREGNPLGQDALHPDGEDFDLRFWVRGVEGNADGQADDTAATAHTLGDLSRTGLVQVAGAIGDDPYYVAASRNPRRSNAAADVDFYHFQVGGPGRYALVAEVFAGRIGSRLDSGVSLFRVDPLTHRLVPVGSNDNTRNESLTTNGQLPLFNDAALFAGLTAGDYYLAVSSGANTIGSDGAFDPNRSHSGTAGFSVGPYVLNLALQADNQAPEVVAVSLTAAATLAAPPTHFSVQFSEPVNLQELAYQAFQPDQIQPVYLEGPDGARYYPRLESYDSATHTAHFLMLDGLGNGDYELHFSGALGLTDFADNPLAGNDPSGDHVVPFVVAGPERGYNGDPLEWVSQEPNDDLVQPQVLGLLFPHELQAGITVTRTLPLDPKVAVPDSADHYQFQVLQNRVYLFFLSGSNLPPGVGLSLRDAAGNLVPAFVRESGDAIQAHLAPGTYVLSVSGWAPTEADEVAYRLLINLGATPGNPPPLTVGPRPASSTHLVIGPPVPLPPRSPAPTPAVPSGAATISVSPAPTEEAPAAPPEAATGATIAPAVPVQGDASVSSAISVPVGTVAALGLQPHGSFSGVAALTLSGLGTFGANSPGSGALPSAQPTGPAAIPAGLLTRLGAGPVGGVTVLTRDEALSAVAGSQAAMLGLFWTSDQLTGTAAPRSGNPAAVEEIGPVALGMATRTRDREQSPAVDLDRLWQQDWFLDTPTDNASTVVADRRGPAQDPPATPPSTAAVAPTGGRVWTALAVALAAAAATAAVVRTPRDERVDAGQPQVGPDDAYNAEP